MLHLSTDPNSEAFRFEKKYLIEFAFSKWNQIDINFFFLQSFCSFDQFHFGLQWRTNKNNNSLFMIFILKSILWKPFEFHVKLTMRCFKASWATRIDVLSETQWSFLNGIVNSIDSIGSQWKPKFYAKTFHSLDKTILRLRK